MGLEGNDALTGGTEADRLFGGRGHDLQVGTRVQPRAKPGSRADAERAARGGEHGVDR
jgi:Ca2+-binding RTX toxin-like protein